MQNWQKNRNYRKIEDPDGSFTYLIKSGGKYVEVNKEIYTVYAQSERQLEYIELDLKRDRVVQDAYGRTVSDDKGIPLTLPEREVSIEKLVEEGRDFPSSTPSPEEIVLKQLEIMELHHYLDFLADDERSLINALFFEGLTERAYSERSGIPQRTINDRKRRVLKKLYHLFKK